MILVMQLMIGDAVKLQNELSPQTGWFSYGVANIEKTVTVSSDTRVSHDFGTEGGESGAPIYFSG